MAWNPPTASVHSFTEASDYNAVKESGCTNSGKGCHGDESAYTDFNAYHPDADCTTCHDYQGVGCIPCHSPREHECALCHDGSMKRAPDRVRISDPYPRGHYRETTHTATATDMKAVVLAAEEGEAKATCAACHSRDLADSHKKVPVVDGSTYGADIGCGECHNDVRSFGLAEVLSNWESRTCEACHKVGSSSPMHDREIADPVEAVDDLGCSDSGSGCHDTVDLHAMHPDAPKDCSGNAAAGEPTCHDLEAESHAPTARRCGGESEEACHRSSDPSGYKHKKVGEVHSPETDAPASETSFNGTPCGSCHYMAPDGRSLISEHARPTSSGAGSGIKGCVNCHSNSGSADAIANDWPNRDTDAACATCHDGDALDAAHGKSLSVIHDSSVGSEGCAASGAGCHPGTDLSLVGGSGDGLHRDCLLCHDKDSSDGNGTYTPGADSCGEGRACHADPGHYDPDTGVHAATGRVDGNDPLHTASAAQAGARYVDSASGTSTSCSACHSVALGGEHARATSSIAGNACDGCHNANPASSRTVKSDWPGRAGEQACANCHGVAQGAEAVHNGITASHTATQKDHDGVITPGYCSKVGCHGTADVRVLHAEKGCAQAVCHSASGAITGSGIMTCGGADGDERSCHTGYSAHPEFRTSHVSTEIAYDGTVGPGGCVQPGCHPSADVTVLHAQTEKYCYQSECHAQNGPGKMACGGNDPSTACHTAGTKHQEFATKHEATEIAHDGTAGPGGCAKPGCHSSSNVTVVHEHKCAIEGCHVEGGPSGRMTCGGNDPETACHTAGTKHLEFGTKHQATEIAHDGTVGPGGCATVGCHPSADVTVVHEHKCAIEGCHVEDGPSGKMTCGGNDPETACHTAGTKHLEFYPKHQATEIAYDGTVGPGGCAVPGCHPSANVTVLHAQTADSCHQAGCHASDGPERMTCGGSDATTACHTSGKHLDFYTRHQGTERDSTGADSPGACVKSGCHISVDATVVHHHTCYIAGCHVTGGPTAQTCGGSSDQTDTCHAGYEDNEHFQSHGAALSGTIAGIDYGLGANDGCLGTCHSEDLVDEHRIRMIGGGLEDDVSTVCAICHATSDAGAYSSSAAVVSAVSTHDRRCVTCHSSASDGTVGVSAPPPSCVPAEPAVPASVEDAGAETPTPTLLPVLRDKNGVRAPKHPVRRREEPRTDAGTPPMKPTGDRPRPHRPESEPPASGPSTMTAAPAQRDEADFKVRHAGQEDPQGREVR